MGRDDDSDRDTDEKCPRCDGKRGWFYPAGGPKGDGQQWQTCDRCGGTGKK